ncbi:MAG: 5-oxoprolinase subunit PxpB [Acidobacteriota bacterium]|nr:MAG: 5-oxoprolinase subunit PxpB [Acidobacteriota bacterium]
MCASPFPGYQEAIPSYRSLLVFYEPSSTTFDDARKHVHELLTILDPSKLPTPPLKEVPTVYDGDDLDDVSRQTGMSREDVIRLHSETEYRVYMVGFTPGFAYMGLTDPKLDVRRRATPRTRVPAGSVAIAMRQTAIYPSGAPGGWHLLGRAEHRTLFDPNATPPSFFVPGDRVKFVPVKALSGLESKNELHALSSSAPAIEVEDGGLLTTVQDRGRPGFGRYGVPVAGAMDPRALDEANRLVGNDPGAAALECTVHGPNLRCLQATVASISGADLGAVVERHDLGRWHPPPGSSFRLRPGNVLAFEGARSGARAYIAFAGGIDVPLVLDSRSTYLTGGFGGYDGRTLHKGDRLALLPSSLQKAGRRIRREPDDGGGVLRMIWGPQDDYFTDKARAILESCAYTVGASSDRMGYRLEGEPLEHRGAQQIVSDGNALGSIQVPPDGLPIVMLADRGTTGGYPKIATVLSDDIPRLVQKLPGESVRFRAVSLLR